MIQCKGVTTRIIAIISLTFYFGLSCYSQERKNINEIDEAVDLANYQYVIYSMTNSNDRQEFIDNCNCESKPTFLSVHAAIVKRKSKTIAFSREFNELKKEIADLDRAIIPFFLTDSIFNNSYKTRYPMVFNYGKKRESEIQFMRFKEELSQYLMDVLKVEELLVKELTNAEISIQNEEVKETQNKTKFDFASFKELDYLSIAISILISILIIVFIYFRFLKNRVSEAVKKHVHKKVSGSYFDKRFDLNQDLIKELNAEIEKLKDQVQKIDHRKEREIQD